MPLTDEQRWQELIHGPPNARRQVQDSPLLPDVWWAYIEHPGEEVDLLFTPLWAAQPGRLARQLHDVAETEGWFVPFVYHQATVAAPLGLRDLLVWALPLSSWWRRRVEPRLARLDGRADFLRRFERGAMPPDLRWWVVAAGTLAWHQEWSAPWPTETEAAEQSWDLLKTARDLHRSAASESMLFSVACNRRAHTAAYDSVRTIKADAARRLFKVETRRIAWAVVDSGIDHTHPALLDKPGSRGARSRVVATYDFTRLRELLDLASNPDVSAERRLRREFGLDADEALELRDAIQEGREIAWDGLAPYLAVEHGDRDYLDDLHPHGTHVAGILGGAEADGKLRDRNEDWEPGVCPDIKLYDLRVLDGEGSGGEFEIIAAIQFIRHLNAHKERPIVHGANLSLSIRHRVERYACGRTPVCEECERLVASGVVTVAAAGNIGFEGTAAGVAGRGLGYRDISITDPGNAESVITVGATHRKQPHAYGISFFSSRGPTGDGRQKPDLIAPGEKIVGPVPGGGFERKDGTSMAAPHVSGAAALLLARHTEFIGHPVRVKQVLCETATDLGRERRFQGCGLVDILRALQAV